MQEATAQELIAIVNDLKKQIEKLREEMQSLRKAVEENTNIHS